MYILIKEYLDNTFTPKSRPAVNTIKSWIEKGKIPGRKIGGLYYVEIDNTEKNDLDMEPDLTRYVAKTQKAR